MAQIESATAELRKLEESESIQPAQETIVTKPMSIRKKMADFKRKASKGVPSAASATTAESSNDSAWGSANAGSSDNSVWGPANPGSSDNSAWGPANPGPSDFETNAAEDDTPDITAMKCKSCGDRGHYANVCPKKDPVKCYNCGEAGHISKACPKPQKKRDPPTCYNCHQEGHTKWDCTNETVLKCRNCDEIGHMSKDCPKPKDWSRVKCNNCGEMGHTAVRCKKPAPSEPSQGADAGFDVGDMWIRGTTPSKCRGMRQGKKKG